MNNAIIISILSTLLASTGFWAFITKVIDKRSAKTKLLLGIAHGEIMSLGMEYIRRGQITKSEYEDLYKYYYEPYKKMGGNGTAERLMREIDKLKMVPDGNMFRMGGNQNGTK